MPDPLIWDVQAKRFVTEPELVAALAQVRYRLLGEIHDNPAHHAIRARLIAALAASGTRPAVVLEQFDLDHDRALVDAQTRGSDAEALADAGGLDRKGWLGPMHKPIIEAALAARLPVRAGNLSRAALRGDVESTAESERSASWYSRFHAARWTDAQQAELRAEIAESHCGKVPDSIVPRIAIAQRLRDAAMAQALIDAASPSGAILIAGDGHVRADLGVPVYLHAPGMPDADARSLSIGFVEAKAEDERAGDFPRRLLPDHPGFDYVWFTPPARREDPCAAMAPKI
jgi:uncharacterized iron-regulated protein